MKRHSLQLRGSQRGLSLVELMVALTIGTFLLAGAISVFGKTRDLYRTNEAAARLQETARYAMSTIEADLRMANYWGLMSRADLIENGPALDLANPPAVDPAYSLPADLAGFATTINRCGAMWAVKLPAYVEANNDAYGYTCPAFGAAVPGSDQLTIRRASTQVIASGAPLANSAGQIKLQTSRVQGSLFSGGMLPAGYLPPLSETRALVVNGYYVDQNSDERAGTPSLRRKQLDFDDAGNAPQIVDQQIAPGVEDLQIEFGGDINDDQNADYYVQPNVAIPAGDEIVAVRVWLLVRAEQQETGFVDGRTYAYASRTGAAAYTPNDAFRRVLVTKTIQLRNTRR
ncbi:MAG TPA: PilW family protein [Vicinamibacterales bacterium]|nr:PilW family protein [Vicinamibacterales bacterium]